MKKMEDYKGNTNLKKMKLVSTTTNETYDKETDEITKISQTKTNKGRLQEPDYVKLYLDDIEVLFRLPKNASNVLYSFLKRMSYKGVIYTNIAMKTEICKELQLKNVKSIDNHIAILVKQDIVKRVDRGTFIINPNLIAKGKWQDILGLRVEYDVHGNRKITPELKKVGFEELDTPNPSEERSI
jgi:hypothetical protein